MGEYPHAGRTPSNFPAFLHTFELPPPVRFLLAHHVVVIICLAPCSDEEGSAHQRCGARADLFDLRNGFGEGGGVDEHRLVESSILCLGCCDRVSEGLGVGSYLGCRAAIVRATRLV